MHTGRETEQIKKRKNALKRSTASERGNAATLGSRRVTGTFFQKHTPATASPAKIPTSNRKILSARTNLPRPPSCKRGTITPKSARKLQNVTSKTIILQSSSFSSAGAFLSKCRERPQAGC